MIVLRSARNFHSFAIKYSPPLRVVVDSGHAEKGKRILVLCEVECASMVVSSPVWWPAHLHQGPMPTDTTLGVDEHDDVVNEQLAHL